MPTPKEQKRTRRKQRRKKREQREQRAYARRLRAQEHTQQVAGAGVAAMLSAAHREVRRTGEIQAVTQRTMKMYRNPSR